MRFCHKRLISTHKQLLIAAGLAVICLFKSICVSANADLCTRVFGPNSHPFFKHLYDWSKTDPNVFEVIVEKDESVIYEGISTATQQISFRRRTSRPMKAGFRKQTMSWVSTANAVKNTSTPQGDVRNVIYLAGQELSQRLGFEFILKNGELYLRVPSASFLEKVVTAMNRVLISHGKEPITYLPVRTGFAKPGETLQISNESQAPILVRFPFADLDPVIAAHEVSFHLGALLYPEKFNLKSRAISLEVSRVVDVIQKLNLPSAEQVGRHLIAVRESNLDTGNANIQAVLGFDRKLKLLSDYSALTFAKADSFDVAVTALQHLTSPYYTPSEVVARQLIFDLGLQSSFSHLYHLVRDMDRNRKIGKRPVLLKLSSVEKAKYIVFINGLLKSQDSNPINQMVPARENLRVWLIDFYTGLDRRIKELIDAADEVKMETAP